MSDEFRRWREKRDYVRDYVEKKGAPVGQCFRRLQESGEYDHLSESVCWIYRPKGWRSGFLLDQSRHMPQFRTSLKSPGKGAGKRYLDALCDFIEGNHRQLDPSSFDGFVRAIESAWLSGSKNGKKIGPPVLRAHVTFWLFMLDPTKHLFILRDKQWKTIQERSVGLEKQPFTHHVYEQLLADANDALPYFAEIKAKDMLDLQTILFRYHQAIST